MQNRGEPGETTQDRLRNKLKAAEELNTEELMSERSQNTVPLVSTQAVYKAPHSTVQQSHSDTSTQSDAVTVAVGSLRA